MYCTGESIVLITPNGNKNIPCHALRAVMHQNTIYAINHGTLFKISISGLITTVTSRIILLDIAVIGNAVYACSVNKIFMVDENNAPYRSENALVTFQGRSYKVIPAPDMSPAVVEIERDRPYVRYSVSDGETYPYNLRQVICASRSLYDDKLVYMTYRFLHNEHQYRIFHDHHEINCLAVTDRLYLNVTNLNENGLLHTTF